MRRKVTIQKHTSPPAAINDGNQVKPNFYLTARRRRRLQTLFDRMIFLGRNSGIQQQGKVCKGLSTRAQAAGLCCSVVTTHQGQLVPAICVSRVIGMLPLPKSGNVEFQLSVPLLQSLKVKVRVPQEVF